MRRCRPSGSALEIPIFAAHPAARAAPFLVAVAVLDSAGAQGRCLAALGKPEAEAPLREARELFTSMGYKTALTETEALLGESEAAAV